MFFPPVAFPAKITIPDQRALIHFTNGTERLVIETRFTGEGTNFAWVIPLPSQPVIEEATTGLFPTLQYLFQPRIIHNVPHFYLGILLVMGLICLFRFAIKYASVGFVILLLFLLALLAGMFLPALGKAGAKAMGMTTSEQAVSILNRKLVGIFETTTIGAHDAKALQSWLSENGYSVPTDSEPVIADYVRQGWVFVAAKIRRTDARLSTDTPHPLSFTFKTEKPVYPMRLTGVDSRPLSVELYVFGPDRARARHFKVARCTRPNYPQPPPNDSWSWNWSRSSPETPNIVHPLLRKWVNGSPVATKLTATLSPSDMRQDVWIDWTPFSEKKNHLFSNQGALTTALNWGSGLFTAGLITICIFRFFNETSKFRLLQLTGTALAASLVLAALIYIFLPKTEARLVRIPYGSSQAKLFELNMFFGDTNAVTRKEISQQIQSLLANPTNNIEWINWKGGSPRFRNLGNDLLGGRIREEDSPGNFTLREHGDQLEFITYDAQGAEHVEPETWTLRSQH